MCVIAPSQFYGPLIYQQRNQGLRLMVIFHRLPHFSLFILLTFCGLRLQVGQILELHSKVAFETGNSIMFASIPLTGTPKNIIATSSLFGSSISNSQGISSEVWTGVATDIVSVAGNVCVSSGTTHTAKSACSSLATAASTTVSSVSFTVVAGTRGVGP